MAVKIRLQRHGRKASPYYYIVVADSRASRDGRYVERIGSYNPNTNPSTVDLDFDRALYWLNVGAQPTDTTRNILSREGVLLMKHLQGGVAKGAFSQEEAEKRFNAWKAEKDNLFTKTKEQEAAAKEKAAADRLKAEKEVQKERAKALAEKRAEEQAAKDAEVRAAAEEAAVVEDAPAEEAPVEEAPAAE